MLKNKNDDYVSPCLRLMTSILTLNPIILLSILLLHIAISFFLLYLYFNQKSDHNYYLL